MSSKTLVNRTGQPLRVTLIVRRGDHAEETAGTVEVALDSEEDRVVSYGNDVDVYLNGIETALGEGSAARTRRDTVVVRGSAFDRELNTCDTIEFLFDGHQVLIAGSNADQHPFHMP